MKKNAPRCDEILIFTIFVGRQRFRRDVFAYLGGFEHLLGGGEGNTSMKPFVWSF